MRLIDADALGKEINFSVTITGKDNAVEVKRLMELYNKAISVAPTIEAEPVKHGEWTHEGIDYMTGQEAYDCQKVFCSECRQESKSYFNNYCPNCGAKMNKE